MRPERPEHPKLPIADVLRCINDGGAVAEFAEALRQAALAVTENGGKASVSIKLTFQKLGARQVTVVPEIAVKCPTRKPDVTVFFVDHDGDFSRSNPDQFRLPAPVAEGPDTASEEE